MSTAPIDVTPITDDDEPLPLGTRHGAARAGKHLIVRPGAVLPDSCIKCNKPAEGFTRTREFRWHSPWLYWLILFPGLLIYAIVALLVSRKLKVAIPFCAEHRRKRLRLILAAWGMVALGIGCFVLAGVMDNGLPALGGILLLIAAAVTGVIASQTLGPVRIDEEGYGTFKGCCAEFLDNLKEAGYKLDGKRVPPL